MPGSSREDGSAGTRGPTLSSSGETSGFDALRPRSSIVSMTLCVRTMPMSTPAARLRTPADTHNPQEIRL